MPRFARGMKGFKSGVTGPLLRSITPAFEHGKRAVQDRMLRGKEMDCRMRKITQTTRMVDIEVGEKNVSHVTSFKAQPFHLVSCCFFSVEPWPEGRKCAPAKPGGRL